MKNTSNDLPEIRKISDLTPYPLNPRSITRDKYENLKLKINRYGQLGALLVDGRDRKTILGGNHAYEAMKELGYETCKVEYRTPKDDAEALELCIIHNERYANWVEDDLAELLYKYKGSIDLSGYTIDLGATTDLKKIMARYGATDEDDFDVKGAIPATPESQPGEVYQMGRHRLMCGDSTNPDDVAKLMGDEKASLIYTDPPYGVSYEGNPNGKDWEMIKNDDLRGENLQVFLSSAFKAIAEHITKNCPAYVHYDSSTHKEFQNALESSGFLVKQQIIWVKHMVIGNCDYHWAHEPLLYCHFGKDKPPFYGDRTNTTILKEAKYDSLKKMSKEELLQMLLAIKERSTVWHENQDYMKGNQYKHPTQKPVKVATTPIKNSSMPDEIVVDLFAGSGTTMVACQQLDRVAYLMEYDPKFCDVIRKRYSKFIGDETNWQKLTPKAK